jgi:hypothetical protein
MTLCWEQDTKRPKFRQIFYFLKKLSITLEQTSISSRVMELPEEFYLTGDNSGDEDLYQ